jgi:DNA-directed RNA polymerase specialized sigma24 family protein
MFRRRAPERASLDRTALEANCAVVVDELCEDFDWRLPDRRSFVRRVGERAAGLLSADPAAAADPETLRRTLEREACAEYFADLYDDLVRGGSARSRALTELFRPEELDEGDGPRAVYRGYLYRAAVFFLLRWTGRRGWSPPPDLVDDLARAAAEDVLMALLRQVELREGRRAFWSYLSRAVERRAIDQLRLLSRRQGSVSLEEMTERHGREGDGGLWPSADTDPMDVAAAAGDLERLMTAARLSVEERFALVAGAYGLNDTEAASELSRRVGRAVGPPDIRRWRFRGREKLRRAAEEDV